MYLLVLASLEERTHRFFVASVSIPHCGIPWHARSLGTYIRPSCASRGGARRPPPDQPRRVRFSGTLCVAFRVLISDKRTANNSSARKTKQNGHKKKEREKTRASRQTILQWTLQHLVLPYPPSLSDRIPALSPRPVSTVLVSRFHKWLPHHVGELIQQVSQYFFGGRNFLLHKGHQPLHLFQRGRERGLGRNLEKEKPFKQETGNELRKNPEELAVLQGLRTCGAFRTTQRAMPR